MKTKFNNKSIFLMGGIILILTVVPIAETIKAQKGDQNGGDKNQPKVDVQVKKQRDEHGNIIRYDSTYSWSWSGNENMPANIDSVFKSMEERFQKNFSLKFGHTPMSFDFRSPFSNDSSMKANPFESWFGDDWADMEANMDRMMKQHQKMMEEFFHHEPLLKVPDGVGEPAPKHKEELKQNQSGEGESKKGTIKENTHRHQGKNTYML